MSGSWTLVAMRFVPESGSEVNRRFLADLGSDVRLAETGFQRSRFRGTDRDGEQEEQQDCGKRTHG